MVKTKVSGVDALIRDFDRKKSDIEDAITQGTDDAAEYLMEKIADKFGRYQPGWAPLKPDTIRKKGFDEPLIETTDMMFSFYKQIAARTRKHVVWILSDDPKLPWHMSGIPKINLPKRDPVRPTAKEENDKCLEIIAEAVRSIL